MTSASYRKWVYDLVSHTINGGFYEATISILRDLCRRISLAPHSDVQAATAVDTLARFDQIQQAQVEDLRAAVEACLKGIAGRRTQCGTCRIDLSRVDKDAFSLTEDLRAAEAAGDDMFDSLAVEVAIAAANDAWSQQQTEVEDA